MPVHVCTCSHADTPHKTYGECLRSKGIGFNGCFPTRSNGAGRGDATTQKKWDAELQRYRDARAQGVQPAGTQTHQIERAMRLSDTAGKAYDASTGSSATRECR